MAAKKKSAREDLFTELAARVVGRRSRVREVAPTEVLQEHGRFVVRLALQVDEDFTGEQAAADLGRFLLDAVLDSNKGLMRRAFGGQPIVRVNAGGTATDFQVELLGGAVVKVQLTGVPFADKPRRR